MSNKLKVLVVGANGMVGTAVSEKLLKSSKVDELTSSTREDTDLFSFKQTEELINKERPDVLIIAAAKVGGILYNNTKRTEFILENLKININLLEATIKFPEIKIINLGSSCIYPLDAKNPISENEFMNGKLEPTNSPYAMAKLTAIELGRSLNIQHGHKIINLMPTNLYGPNDYFHESNGHVIPSLIHKMHNAKINERTTFEIWGSGSPMREFLYVSELADCIEHLIDLDTNIDLLNVGSGQEVTIKELAQKIKDTIGFEGELKFDSSMPDGNPRKLLDSSLINELGWKSKIDLNEGLAKTYKWYIENEDTLRS
tara:strand:+ start:406 stop:1350 length:945 start_codon:yes stop_codon:yes gene_type:complete